MIEYGKLICHYRFGNDGLSLAFPSRGTTSHSIKQDKYDQKNFDHYCNALYLCAFIKRTDKDRQAQGVRHNTPDAQKTRYYENTIPALKFSQSLGIYAAEFDVQLTSDEKIIVFMDLQFRDSE